MLKTLLASRNRKLSFVTSSSDSMAARRAPQLLSFAVLAALFVWNTAFLPVETPAPKQAAAAAAAATLSVAPLPALAGEPPSVGIHWYWDLGIGTIHGETASIVIWVFLVCLIFALAGAGGSSRKSAA